MAGVTLTPPTGCQLASTTHPQVLIMERHVCAQNDMHDRPAEEAALIGIQVCKEIVLLLIQQLERQRSMPVLIYAVVVVPHC